MIYCSIKLLESHNPIPDYSDVNPILFNDTPESVYLIVALKQLHAVMGENDRIGISTRWGQDRFHMI